MRLVLRLPAFRRLLAAYTLNELAWPIGTVALAVLVYRRTGSAMGAMAYFLAAQFVPALIAPLLVGRVDRLAARAVLPVLYAFEAIAFLLLGMLSSPFALAPVLILTVADGVAALTARSIARATTAAVTSPAGLLREGNALANATFSVCFLTGPAIGGVVVATGGTALALYLNSGLFAVVAVLILSAPGLPLGEPHEGGVTARLREALSLARREPRIRTLLQVQGMAVLVFTMSIPVEIVLVQHSLHAGAGGYGVLVSAWGAGSLAGSADLRALARDPAADADRGRRRAACRRVRADGRRLVARRRDRRLGAGRGRQRDRGGRRPDGAAGGGGAGVDGADHEPQRVAVHGRAGARDPARRGAGRDRRPALRAGRGGRRFAGDRRRSCGRCCRAGDRR